MSEATAIKILNFERYQGRDGWRLSRNLTHVVSGGIHDDARPLWMIEVKEAVAAASLIFGAHEKFMAEFGPEVARG